MHLLVPVLVEKGRRSAPVGMASLFDEEEHPRDTKGEFAKKEAATEAPREKQPAAPLFHEDYTGPRYTYGLTNRPAGYGQIPEGYVVGSDRPHGDFRHGTIDYPRELTPDEAQGFELRRVHPEEVGGMSGKDMIKVAALIADMDREKGWDANERAELDALKAAHTAGPGALAAFLRATQATNAFSYSAANEVTIPAPPPDPTPAPAPAEPWQMTRSEFLRSRPLPPPAPIPMTGHFPAVTTDDGQIYVDTKSPRHPTHTRFIEAAGIPPERVTGGGFITDGEYDDYGPRSDAGKNAEIAQAAQRIKHKYAVKRAVEEGQPVPAHVLKQYPELSKGLRRLVLVIEKGRRPTPGQTGFDFRDEDHPRAANGEFVRKDAPAMFPVLYRKPGQAVPEVRRVTVPESDGHREGTIPAGRKQAADRIADAIETLYGTRPRVVKREEGWFVKDTGLAPDEVNDLLLLIHQREAKKDGWYVYKGLRLLVPLDKARIGRKPTAGQTGFNFEEEDHPREAAGGGDGKYKPGQFVPKPTPPTPMDPPTEPDQPVQQPETTACVLSAEQVGQAEELLTEIKEIEESQGEQYKIQDIVDLCDAALAAARQGPDALAAWVKDQDPETTPASDLLQMFPQLGEAAGPVNRVLSADDVAHARKRLSMWRRDADGDYRAAIDAADAAAQAGPEALTSWIENQDPDSSPGGDLQVIFNLKSRFEKKETEADRIMLAAKLRGFGATGALTLLHAVQDGRVKTEDWPDVLNIAEAVHDLNGSADGEATLLDAIRWGSLASLRRQAVESDHPNLREDARALLRQLGMPVPEPPPAAPAAPLQAPPVTPDRIKEAFALRDVAFTGKPTRAQIQKHTLGVGRGFFDLAKALDLDPREVGFKGRLKIDIGAVKGIRGAAAAYYRTEKKIVVGTAHEGSLAHEWWHAVDHALAGGGYSTYASESWLPTNPAAPHYRPVNVALTALKEAIKGSQFEKDARTISRSRGQKKGYWHTMTELTARAFDAYITDKLEAQGKRNEYLTHHGSHQANWQAAGFNVEPLGADRVKINAAFDAVFDTIRADRSLLKALRQTEEPDEDAMHDTAGFGLEETEPGKQPRPVRRRRFTLPTT
jgi:hypothetical protein